MNAVHDAVKEKLKDAQNRLAALQGGIESHLEGLTLLEAEVAEKKELIHNVTDEIEKQKTAIKEYMEWLSSNE